MSDDKSKKTPSINDLGSNATPEQIGEAVQATLNEFKEGFEKIDRANRERRARAVQTNFQGVCDEWAKRDFWLIREGINLLMREHPETRSYDEKFTKLWAFARTCIGPGGSLFVVNPEAKALTKAALSDKYRVRPADLLAWAKSKQVLVPQELLAAVYGDAPVTPTSAGTASQEEKKRARRQSIRQFKEVVYRRAKEVGLEWAVNNGPINVTKEEFKDLFERYTGVSPEDQVKLETFKLDLKELGIPFARGVKKRSNNDLEKLFNA
jgi:hypothetical protein